MEPGMFSDGSAANTPIPTTAEPPSESYAEVALSITACPACGKPAEVIGRGSVVSTDGPVEIIRVICLDGHSFLMDADRLPLRDARSAESWQQPT
jgi:hypothetical protein